MQREHHMGAERASRARIEKRQEWREGERHQDDQRLGVEQGGGIEDRREGGERLVPCFEPGRGHAPRRLLPILIVKVGLQRRGEDRQMGPGLDREEQGVGDQEELERPEIGPPLAHHIKRGQRAGRRQQGAKAAHQFAVDTAQSREDPRGEIVDLEVARPQRLLAAARAKGRRAALPAARAGPS